MISLELLQSMSFIDCNGNPQKLTSSIDKEEVMFLNGLIKKYKPNKTLEIGCAEGISSLTICESLNNSGHHTIIDPYQTTYWNSYGINNLKAGGFTNFNLIEERSEIMLPEMYKSGNKYDFIFVDGWHTFDHVLVEFFFINHLLNIGGIVVFDDASMPGLNKLMRYISNYPNYQCIGSGGGVASPTKIKFLKFSKKLLNIISYPLSKKLQRQYFDDSVLRSDESLMINGTIVAFEKKAEDERGWGWFENF